jgi:hypothetical protein
MRTILLLLSITVSSVLFAQTSEIEQKFKEYGFSKAILTESLKGDNANHSFDAQITTIIDTKSKTKVEEAKFDPTKKDGERWILISVNNETPSKKEIKQFNKAHNIKQPNIKVEVDKNSWAIESDDDDYLVISFKYDAQSLPKKYAYLGECKGLAFFDKKTITFKKAEFVNEKPVKVNILNVTELDMVILYTYNAEENLYFIQKQDLRMTAILLGQAAHVNQITVYDNYIKAN